MVSFLLRPIYPWDILLTERWVGARYRLYAVKNISVRLSKIERLSSGLWPNRVFCLQTYIKIYERKNVTLRFKYQLYIYM